MRFQNFKKCGSPSTKLSWNFLPVWPLIELFKFWIKKKIRKNVREIHSLLFQPLLFNYIRKLSEEKSLDDFSSSLPYQSLGTGSGWPLFGCVVGSSILCIFFSLHGPNKCQVIVQELLSPYYLYGIWCPPEEELERTGKRWGHGATPPYSLDIGM